MSEEGLRKKGAYSAVRRSDTTSSTYRRATRPAAIIPLQGRKRKPIQLHAKQAPNPELAVTTVISRDWRPDPSARYMMDDRASAGMPRSMKASLREAARILSHEEGKRVSMSEIVRRLLAAGGLT